VTGADRSENAYMEYQRWWSARRSTAGFGEVICDAWASEYLEATGADPSDLVIVDPGNGFNYLFDLACTLRGDFCSRAPRVVGVWGFSRTADASRDSSRMRGHPRSDKWGDDRGHLISCVSGGGYDINLVAMNAALNRGWSAEGSRFRSMERRAAACPGTLFFIRPVYEDGTDRPSRFEAGVQDGRNMLTDVFANCVGRADVMRTSIMSQCSTFPVDASIVTGCLDPASSRDSLFTQAWKSGPATLTRTKRCAIAGVTGHLAESVIELLLDRMGWRVLWHFTGPGRHGIDLALLTPDGKIVAVEVKGTLVARRIPRLSRRELGQMTTAWVDKADNPGMVELGLNSTDVYGAVSIINFADMTWPIAITANFAELRPITRLEQLTSLGWIPANDRTGPIDLAVPADSGDEVQPVSNDQLPRLGF
jgi:DNA/RNA non-specific endonuclease